MYKTCIYCNRSLGENESVENFPIGRRLAFDQSKGRLWVICGECRRWNLTPLEERWEAIEECERSFRDTKTRYSTDNIGLARLREGLDLVRIGRPLRPEYAAWRYGREFLKRRVAIEASIVYDAFVAVYDAWVAFLTGGEQRVITRVRDDEGRHLLLTRSELKDVRLQAADTAEGWILNVPHRIGLAEREWWREFVPGSDFETAELTGSAALRAAGKILPKVNPYGGNDRQVKGAVRVIEEQRGLRDVFTTAARRPGYTPGVLFDTDVSVLKRMPPVIRLALEMAAHEEAERRALEGELSELEEAWREAEQIAAIADRLLVPEEIEEWIRVHALERRENEPGKSSVDS